MKQAHTRILIELLIYLNSFFSLDILLEVPNHFLKSI